MDYKKNMDTQEKRNRRIMAVGEIHTAGFDIVHRHENTVEPMLMGGCEYIARRGSYLLYYSLKEENICLQKTDREFIDWDEPFIIKWKPFSEFTECLSLTIALEIGKDFYDGL